MIFGRFWGYLRVFEGIWMGFWINSDEGDQGKVNEQVLIRYLGEWMIFGMLFEVTRAPTSRNSAHRCTITFRAQPRWNASKWQWPHGPVHPSSSIGFAVESTSDSYNGRQPRVGAPLQIPRCWVFSSLKKHTQSRKAPMSEWMLRKLELLDCVKQHAQA